MQNLFSRSPWERAAVVPLHGRSLGQGSSPECETTPEGGLRCANGTYYPKGCAPTSGAGIQAAPPAPGSIVPLVAVGVAAAAAGAYLLMSGHRHEMGDPLAFEETYPEAAAQLRKIADKINSERANDAYYFAKYIDASKRRQELVFVEDAAQKALAEQERIWSASHKNPEQYQAAQAAYDQAVSQKAQAAQEMQENRDGINLAAQNVLVHRNNAEAVISQLPVEIQAEAWRIIDPCSFKPAGMQGSSSRAVRVVNR